MKLNNKGMTVVELVITFAILTILIGSMLAIVLEIRDKAVENRFKSKQYDFKNVLIKTIEDDVLRKTKVSSYTDSANSLCEGTIILNNDESRSIKISIDNKKVIYNGIEYDIPDKDLIDMDSCSIEMKELAEEDVLIISISYHEKGKSTTASDYVDYGFKIVAPTS